MDCTLLNLMTETNIGVLILFVGCSMGLFAAIDSNWKDARTLELLSYNNYKAQIINRILFTGGCICCLFVDFPSRADWVGKHINFIIFPTLGLCAMCIAWALTYHILRCIVWIVCWWFDKK